MKKTINEIIMVDIGKIRPNKYNPNVMDEKVFEQTRKNVLKEGLVGAITCREDKKEKGKYIIIDGEHRWKIAKSLGYTKMPIIVLERKLSDAMISTINFNKLRGEFDTLRLATVIHELNKTYSMKELEDRLGYTLDELNGLEKLSKIDFDDIEKDLASEEEKDPSIEEYKFEVILSKKQYKIVQDAIEITGKENTPEALVIICLDYLAKYGKTK